MLLMQLDKQFAFVSLQPARWRKQCTAALSNCITFTTCCKCLARCRVCEECATVCDIAFCEIAKRNIGA